jgi:putative ABC transport system permease protein
MRRTRAFFARLRGLFGGARREDALAEELESHLQLQIEDNLRSGMSPAEARREALLKSGGIETAKEAYRDRASLPLVESLLQDLRYGVRMLRRSPAFTAVAVGTLAVAIGATTAIFSAVNPILFESLPYPHAGRIMAVWEIRDDGSRNDATFGMYQGLLERNRSFEALAVVKPWQPTLTGAAEPEPLRGQRVSWGFFRVLGVSPILGRDFLAADDRLRSPSVVILSDRLWRRRFDSDPAILGRAITLEEDSSESSESNRYTVIGVMPRAFSDVLSPSAELWTPLQYDLSGGRAWGHHLRLVGRLRSGVAADRAAAELASLGRAVIAERRPDSYGSNVKFALTPLQSDVTRGVRPALLAVLGAVLLVLVIACVNVANLLLARGARRRAEFGLRAAIGAGRGRLVRQLLTESLLLAAAGGAAGIAVAMLGVRALRALAPPELPRADAIGIDGGVFLFAFAVTALVGVGFGLAPALQASRSDPRGDLFDGARSPAAGHRRVGAVLVVAEVALALILSVCCGLLLRSLQRLFAVPPGFEPSRVLTMQVTEVGHRYDDDAARHRFFAEALEEVRRVPGVASAAFVSQLPLSGDSDLYGVFFERDQDPRAGEQAFRYAATRGYLETMGISVTSGRSLDERDRAGAPRVALISEAFAKRKFADQDPLGQKIHIGPPDDWYTIIGVTGDVKQMSLALGQPDAVYVASTQWPWADTKMSLVVRARGDAAALAPAIRKAIWSVDKDQPIMRVATMDELVAASAAERRFALILFEAFGAVALMLAAAGIYGILAGTVAERTREIGIRAALGATRKAIVGLVFRQGMQLTGLGVAIGLVGAAAATEAIAVMLFGVSRLDPITYLGVVALLVAVASAACGVPAWRAARVDPARTLRSE